MIITVQFLVIFALFACNNQVLANPYPSGHNQWGDQPRVGMMGGYQQPQGFGGQQRGYNGGGGAGNFGQGGGYSQNRGGQQWQSGGQGAEAYKMNVFNEPDRYGYDYTIPGATVHYLMHKKQGNQGSGSRGGSSGGWNNNY